MSTKSLNSIIRKDTYYWYALERPKQRSPKKIKKIWFTYVLVNKAHDINNLFLKNLVILVGEEKSIWFITESLLFNDAKKLVEFVTC